MFPLQKCMNALQQVTARHVSIRSNFLMAAYCFAETFMPYLNIPEKVKASINLIILVLIVNKSFGPKKNVFSIVGPTDLLLKESSMASAPPMSSRTCTHDFRLSY